MNRQAMLERIQTRTHPWDIVVVGGGATGVGVALDAACRGYDVALFEQADFGKGTSSRSTKLVHGGLRYLQQGNLALVREALRERSLLRNNAPQLVKDLSFVVPTYRWWEGLYYGLGLQAYNLLGRGQFGRSRRLSRQQTLACLPTLQSENLRGGILYHDGLFDDARFLIQLARTAADHGATLINHAPVVGLLETRTGMGLVVRDEETGEELPIPARTVVNATGPFSDAFRRLCDPKAKPFLVHSQGVHLVLPWEFLEGECALLIPRTRDGRLLFVIPWLGHVLVGTTDLPLEQVPLEPRATEEEIDFLLSTVAAYLKKQPTRAEVLSVFAGIRALIAPPRSRYHDRPQRLHHRGRQVDDLSPDGPGLCRSRREVGSSSQQALCHPPLAPSRLPPRDRGAWPLGPVRQ
jgi:glycerol-3-phosphate dehydrogenase